MGPNVSAFLLSVKVEEGQRALKGDIIFNYFLLKLQSAETSEAGVSGAQNI